MGRRNPEQYERAALRKLQDTLDRAGTKLAASQKRYKDSFNRQDGFRPIIRIGQAISSTWIGRPAY